MEYGCKRADTQNNKTEKKRKKDGDEKNIWGYTQNELNIFNNFTLKGPRKCQKRSFFFLLTKKNEREVLFFFFLIHTWAYYNEV